MVAVGCGNPVTLLITPTDNLGGGYYSGITQPTTLILFGTCDAAIEQFTRNKDGSLTVITQSDTVFEVAV